MSASKRTSVQARRSPVGNRKSKTPRAGKNQSVLNGLKEFVPEPARNSSSPLGKEEVAKMNLMTIQKLDSSVKAIKSTVPQVILYEYDGVSNTWERTSVEGTLFVCEREAKPHFGFVVLNTLHSENSMETIIPGMEFRTQEPFVLYKKESDSKIYGLCFQEMAMCKEIGDLLNRLSHSRKPGAVTNGHIPVAPQRSASAIEFSLNKPEQAPKVDLLEMLEAAGRSYLGQTFSDGASSPDSLSSEPIQLATHGVSTVASSTVEHRSTHSTPTQYTNTVTPASYPARVPGVRVTSRTGSVSPQKQQYSQKASQYQLQHDASLDEPYGFTPRSAGAHHSEHSRSVDHGSGIVRKLFTQGDQNMLSQSLNLQPSSKSQSSVPLRAISLDEVEKQMTAEVSTPELNMPFTLLNTTADNKHPNPSEQQPNNVLLQPSVFASTATPAKVKTLSKIASSPSLSVQPPTPITTQQPSLGGAKQLFPPIPPLMHSAGMKAPPIAPQNRNGDDPPKRHSSSSSAFQAPISVPNRASSEPSFHGRSSEVIQSTLSPLPELLTSQPRTTSPISSTLMSPHQFRDPSEQTAPRTTSPQDTTPVSLSKEQLVQAFEYLLKTDAHFVDLLHHAYKQSVMSRHS